jgi:UDP-glucose 4-epimerase
MTILVTGGAGYIGSHTVLALTDAGQNVVVIDNLSTGSAKFLPKVVPLFVGDVADEALVERIIVDHRVDSIIHLAGSIAVRDSIRDPLAYYRNNTMAAHHLLGVTVKCNVKRFIFSSSAAVYGTPDHLPVAEGAPTNPLSPYGSSKLMVEAMLRDVAAAYDVNFVVLRYFNVAGADPRGRSGLATVGATHLMKIAIEVATGQRAQVDVFGTDYPTPDGSCIRDFIHVSDLADVHRTALSYLAGGGASAILNCGYGRGHSVLEVIASVRRACGHDFAVRYADRRPGDIMAIVADTRRIRSEFHWVPQYDDLDLMVGHALKWEHQLIRNYGLLERTISL